MIAFTSDLLPRYVYTQMSLNTSSSLDGYIAWSLSSSMYIVNDIAIIGGYILINKSMRVSGLFKTFAIYMKKTCSRSIQPLRLPLYFFLYNY